MSRNSQKLKIFLSMMLLTVFVLFGQQKIRADELETPSKSEETTTGANETTPPETTTVAEETTEPETPTQKAGWIKTKNGYKYQYATGKFATYGFINVDGTKYFIDKNGYRTSGIFTYKGKKYYTVKGALYPQTGIIKYKKNNYYCKKGQLKTGLKKVGKSYYYFDKKTYKMQKNKLIKIKGTYYKFNKSGKGIKKSKGAGAAIDLINKITSPKDSSQTKLRKGFNYMVKHYRYAVKPGYFSPSGKGWEENYGYNMIKTHSGRCYSFAAAFCLYAREVGYPARVVAGSISGGAPHAWCEVNQGNVWYIYDPNLAYENKNIGTYYKRSRESMGGFYRR